jgi:hypothetical protein
MGTANYDFPYIATNQSSPEITHNEALDDIDAAIHSVAGESSPTLPELLVTPPAHYNSDGTAGQLAIGNDGGSPPNSAFFICLVTGSSLASPPTTALWLMVNALGVFSTSF